MENGNTNRVHRPKKRHAVSNTEEVPFNRVVTRLWSLKHNLNDHLRHRGQVLVGNNFILFSEIGEVDPLKSIIKSACKRSGGSFIYRLKGNPFQSNQDLTGNNEAKPLPARRKQGLMLYSGNV